MRKKLLSGVLLFGIICTQTACGEAITENTGNTEVTENIEKISELQVIIPTEEELTPLFDAQEEWSGYYTFMFDEKRDIEELNAEVAVPMAVCALCDDYGNGIESNTDNQYIVPKERFEEKQKELFGTTFDINEVSDLSQYHIEVTENGTMLKKMGEWGTEGPDYIIDSVEPSEQGENRYKVKVWYFSSGETGNGIDGLKMEYVLERDDQSMYGYHIVDMKGTWEEGTYYTSMEQVSDEFLGQVQNNNQEYFTFDAEERSQQSDGIINYTNTEYVGSVFLTYNNPENTQNKMILLYKRTVEYKYPDGTPGEQFIYYLSYEICGSLGETPYGTNSAADSTWTWNGASFSRQRTNKENPGIDKFAGFTSYNQWLDVVNQYAEENDMTLQDTDITVLPTEESHPAENIEIQENSVW